MENPRGISPEGLELSVVIPLYNGGEFFRNTIESLMAQTLDRSRFEIVVVDDGSSDGSEIFCDELATQHPGFFRVLHQKNSGSPAGPRNTGARLARGTYVFFVDADDAVPPTSFETMLRHAKEKQLDIGLFKVDASSWGQTYGGLFDQPQDNCTVMNSLIMNSLAPYKLFRRSIIIDNDIHFPEGILYEDLPFVLECYLHAERISIITDQIYYIYSARDDGGSISQSVGAARLDEQVEGVANYLNVASKYARPQECPHIYTRAYRYLCYALPHIIDQGRKDLLEQSAAIAQEHFCDQVRSLMSFANMTYIDVLIAKEDRLLASILKEHPLLSFTGAEEDDADVTYELRALDEEGAYPAEADFSKNLPRDFGWRRKHLEQPKIVHNQVTKATLSSDDVTFEGRMQILRACEGPALEAKLRTKQGIASSAEIELASCENVYANVWHMVFKWHASMPLAAIEPTGTGKQMVHFYLDVELPNGETIENRFGRYRTPNVFEEFAQGAATIGTWTMTPAQTEYYNLSLCLTPIKAEEPLKTTQKASKASLPKRIARKLAKLASR